MRRVKPLCLLLLLLFPQWSYGLKADGQHGDWQLHEIVEKPSGFMERESGDPYIVFPELKEVQYNIRGVQVEVSFSPMIVKPFLMELFWRPEHDGFSEQRKVFFVLLPQKDTDSIKFYIPLNSQDGYKQFRLDLPGDLDSLFKVRDFRPISDEAETGGHVQRVEPFYHIGAAEVRTPEIFIPYLVHTIRHGLSRLLKDPAFFIVWLVLIFTALFAARTVSRSLRSEKVEVREEEQDTGSDPHN